MSLRLDGPDADVGPALPDDPTEPADMDPADRLDEIAGILAYGILRLHVRTLPGLPATADHRDCPNFGLELSTPTRPDGVAG